MCARLLARFTIAWVAVLAASPVHAQATRPSPGAARLSGSRALAMGDAFRAVATSNEAIYLNPAGMAQTEKYEIDVAYALNRGDDLSRFNASVVDARTLKLATGLAYTRVTGDGLDGASSGHLVHLAFAYPFSDVGTLGVGFKYLGFSAPDPTNAVTADVGLHVRAADWFTLGGALYNFIDVASREAPLGAGLGVAVGDDSSFRLAADAAFDLSDTSNVRKSYHGGGEYLFAGAFPIRAGFQRLDDDDRNYVSAGIGYVAPEAALDVTYLQNLAGAEADDRLFSFTVKLFL